MTSTWSVAPGLLWGGRPHPADQPTLYSHAKGGLQCRHGPSRLDPFISFPPKHTSVTQIPEDQNESGDPQTCYGKPGGQVDLGSNFGSGVHKPHKLGHVTSLL